jgi:hypothetical protein
MTIVLLLAMLVGVCQAYKEISDVRSGVKPGVQPSKNLIDFVFLNK